MSLLPPPPSLTHLNAKKGWFELPGAKRPGEEYSEQAYKRAFRRTKRNADDDNRKRKERSNYNVSVQEKRDREYSDWA